jgi:hypothetical protein
MTRPPARPHLRRNARGTDAAAALMAAAVDDTGSLADATAASTRRERRLPARTCWQMLRAQRKGRGRGGRGLSEPAAGGGKTAQGRGVGREPLPPSTHPSAA